MSRHERPRLLFAGELRAIAAVFALALLLLAALAASHLGAFLMKRLVTFTAIATAAVALAGCAGMPGITQGASTKDFLQHIETCKRHYTGTISATGVNGSLDIQCDPVSAAPAP